MTRIAIVGGHGKIARLLIPLLVDRGDEPVALVRNPDYAEELEDLGAEVTLLDIERSDADAFAEAFTGADAVVFAAGGGADGNVERKKTVDLGGSLKSIAGARAAGVRRFVQISAIGVDEPVPADAAPAWVAYVDAKRDADVALRDSDLDWTIIRPGGLTDDACDRLGRPWPRPSSAARCHEPTSPAVIAAVLDDPATYRHQWELVSGSDAHPRRHRGGGALASTPRWGRCAGVHAPVGGAGVHFSRDPGR